MGNRAVITLDNQPTGKSVGIYLHWNGGEESILAFAEAAKHLHIRKPDDDPPYSIARLVQVIGNYFGGTLSLGVGILEHLDCDNGNNGVFIVGWDENGVTLKNSPKGHLTMHSFTDCDQDKIKKHVYWKRDDTGKNILDNVLAANALPFKG